MPTLEPQQSDYGDAFEEARACRSGAALFDFSFVHRARVSGPQSARLLESFQPRNCATMEVGRIIYSLRTDKSGRVISDLTLWRFDRDCYQVMSGNRADIEALLSLQGPGCVIDDLSANSAILAVQGPESLRRLGQFMDTDAIASLPYFGFCEARIDDIECLVGRLGYSGEKGFEILFDESHRASLWAMLAGKIRPAGFDAINILRIEAGFILFTQECRAGARITELGLSALFPSTEQSGRIKLSAFRAASNDRLLGWKAPEGKTRLPRAGEISVTSACYSPHFEQTVGLGFVSAANQATRVTDPIHGFGRVELSPLPLYDPRKRIPRADW